MKVFLDAVIAVISFVTTTGFTTVDFNRWPAYSQIILLILMFTGACSGSTSGALKISRFLLLGKAARSEIRRLVSPRSVKNIRFNGKTVNQDTIHAVYSFFALYVFIYVISLLLISLNNDDLLTSLSAVVSALNNIGPGFGDVGYDGDFRSFNTMSKLVLCFDMLVGRLEIFPMLVLIMPKTWKKY